MSESRERYRSFGERALVVGIAALAVSLVGLFLDPEQFYRSWLLAFLFWIAIPLGSFGFVCLHNMSGGAWGFVIRRILESAAATMPLTALLFLPIVFGVEHLYPWANPEVVASDPLLQHKAPYLNVPFFLIRAAIYFALWIGGSWLIVNLSRRQDRGDQVRVNLTRRMQLLSGAGLPLYALTVSFAAIDWGMTLEPHWFSTVYGMIFVAGQGLTTLAFAIIVLSILRDEPPLDDVVKPAHFGDLGSLTFAFVMLWAYLAFSQYLIIWSGNLPEEISWYLHRSHGGWQFIGPALMAFHFALPFLLLLSKRRKQDPRSVAKVAGWILVARWVELYWVIMPSFYTEGLHLHWMDLTVWVGMGGLWLAFFLRQLTSRSLLPENDPRLAEALEPAEAH